jgi:hypothetical protein
MARHAELSSLGSSLDDLVRRVTALADSARREAADDVAAELFAVERSLKGALRRLERLAASAR